MCNDLLGSKVLTENGASTLGVIFVLVSSTGFLWYRHFFSTAGTSVMRTLFISRLMCSCGIRCLSERLLLHSGHLVIQEEQTPKTALFTPHHRRIW